MPSVEFTEREKELINIAVERSCKLIYKKIKNLNRLQAVKGSDNVYFLETLS